MSELKPCPFCGKSDIHIEQKGTFFWCECYDCGAIGRGYYTQPGVNVLQSEDIARGYWNQRPLEDALHTRIAGLEAARHGGCTLARTRTLYLSGYQRCNNDPTRHSNRDCCACRADPVRTVYERRTMSVTEIVESYREQLRKGAA